MAVKAKVEAELAGVKASKAEDLRGAKERALVSLAGDVNGLAVELAEKAVGQSLDHGAQLAFLAALQPNQNN